MGQLMEMAEEIGRWSISDSRGSVLPIAASLEEVVVLDQSES